MAGYKLETHLHTSESSKCAISNAALQVDFYKMLGYDGAIITDHFITGNTAVDRSLPWEVQIEHFYRGFENARKRGDEIGFDVYEGLEYNYKGTEFLVLNLPREFWYKNERVCDMHPSEFIPLFQQAGAFVIQAHPYRQAPYIEEIRLFEGEVDAIEVFNLANSEMANSRALELAIRSKKPMTAGSDCHESVGRKAGAGVLLPRRPEGLGEIVDMIRGGSTNVFRSLEEV